MILVTGGTGFVGREVVEKLAAMGQPVRVLARHPERAKDLARLPRVDIVRGDALRPATLRAAMVGVQTVIHLVGIIAETSHVTYEEVHIEATRNLLAAAKEAGVTRWIQMSAIGTRPHARSRYHLTKWAAEELVRQSGLDWTILRPSLIYGYDERDRLLNLLRMALSWPFDLAQLYSLPLLDGGDALVQPVSVREVAHCFALAPSKEASVGQTIDLVGPVAISWREMVFKILHALGKKGLYEEIPLLMIVRKILWLTVLVLPILLIVGLATGRVGVPAGVIGAGLWVVLALVARSWRTVVIFSLPGEPLILAAEALAPVLPRELQGSEPLKMAREDNTGNPRPAAEIFAYTPETFEQGLANIYRI